MCQRGLCDGCATQHAGNFMHAVRQLEGGHVTGNAITFVCLADFQMMVCAGCNLGLVRHCKHLPRIAQLRHQLAHGVRNRTTHA